MYDDRVRSNLHCICFVKDELLLDLLGMEYSVCYNRNAEYHTMH
jgi:hypothetical protein